VDLLTDILLQAGVKRRILDLRRLNGSACVRFPCDKSMGLHVVTHGSVYVHAPTLSQPLALHAGDIALMARGCDHVVSTSEESPPAARVTLAHAWVAQSADEDPAAAHHAVISGAYQFWNRPLHPLFSQIPDWMVLRGDSFPKLGPMALTIALLDEEVNQKHLGAETIVHGLLDVVFTYALREMVERLGLLGQGWSHAVQDPQVRQVLARMHEDCARAWTLEDLAAAAGLSRTGLAERFRIAMGDTPLSHLRAVRIQKAMRLLSESERTLEQVAGEVGYQDAFSFSKVFKRVVGISPREFRRKDAEELNSPWRFKTG
jgi:AraC-like DNA-binding protein